MAFIRRLCTGTTQHKIHAHGYSRHYSIPVLVNDRQIMVAMSCPLLEDASFKEKIAVLDRDVFGERLRRDILHLCVTQYRDNIRQGTANTRTRGEVAGSGRKIRPQKGSGRARLGDAQSPMLRGGGVAFGPKPRNFGTKLPRKVQHLGLRVALSAKLREKRLAVVENMDWDGVKTGHFHRRMKHLGWEKSLLVTGKDGNLPQLERVSRNIPSVKVMRAGDLHVYEALKWPKLILDIGAIEYFEGLLGRVSSDQRIPYPRQKSLRFSRMLAGRELKKSPRIPGVEIFSGQNCELLEMSTD